MLDDLKNAALALSARKNRRDQHPDEPWLWREDWAARAVQDSAGFAMTGCFWAFGMMWTMMCLPIVLVFTLSSTIDDPKFWFVLLFPLVGLAILGTALYLTLRRRKYGVSVCHLERVPIAIGHTFRGHVEARVSEIPDDGFHLRLMCVRRIVRSSGSKSSVDETTLWQDETTVMRGAAARTESGTRIPFSFAIPPHSDPADERNQHDRVIWRLHVSADVPGIDYGAMFELPVFETGEAPSFHTSGMTAVPQPQPDSGVTTDGEAILVAPKFGFREVAIWMVFAVFWFGILGAMWGMGMPRWFGSIFFAIGFVFVILTLDFALGRTRIQATRAELRVQRSWLGFRRTRVFTPSEIEAIETRLGSAVGGRAYYDVIVRFKAGRGATKIAKNISHKINAEAVAGRVRRQVGV